MKRVWKISETAQSELSLLKPKTLISKTPFLFTNNILIKTQINRFLLADYYCSQPNISSNPYPNIIGLFENRWSNADIQAKQELVHMISVLRDELIGVSKNGQNEIFRVLDEKGSSLFRVYANGDAFVELVKQLESWPCCALEVTSFSPFCDYDIEFDVFVV